jgi:hypothetical protein
VLEWLPALIGSILGLAVQALGLFVAATFVFDAIHHALHLASRSRRAWIRELAAAHRAHHEFLDSDLAFHPEHRRRNLVGTAVPEYLTQMTVCALGFLVLEPSPVLAVMMVFTALFLGVAILGGRDRRHVDFEVVPAAHAGALVRAPYHALHHVNSGYFLGSYTTLFDRLMGTACPLAGRVVAMTGASGAFGSALRVRLERAGARVVPLKYGRDYSYDDYSGAESALAEADILALCHGSKGIDAMSANCESFLALIERFRSATRNRRFAPEVWAVGSEIECHPSFGVPELKRYAASKRSFARQAARYFHDQDFLYRHIVPSAFRSPMGPGLMSGRTAAAIALFLIRRGFQYVPVTYTGIALVNAVPFLARSLAAGRSPMRRRWERPDAKGRAMAWNESPSWT